MIVDVRTYTLHPGSLGAYFKLYESEGFAIQTKHLGQPLGYYFIDIGPQNRTVHLWGYPDIATRAARRAAMEADPAWTAYRGKSAAFFQRQENKIMRCAPFHPARTGAVQPFGIVDYRTYTAQPGKLGTFLNVYETDALPVQMKHLGNNVGWYMSDIGPQNEVLHMWGYRDLADRTARRNAMQADPAWTPYLAKGTALLVNMDNVILRPAPFWKQAG
jgi:hypothetical protein